MPGVQPTTTELESPASKSYRTEPEIEIIAQGFDVEAEEAAQASKKQMEQVPSPQAKIWGGHFESETFEAVFELPKDEAEEADGPAAEDGEAPAVETSTDTMQKRSNQYEQSH